MKVIVDAILRLKDILALIILFKLRTQKLIREIWQTTGVRASGTWAWPLERQRQKKKDLAAVTSLTEGIKIDFFFQFSLNLR